jgi:hypothetical protein
LGTQSGRPSGRPWVKTMAQQSVQHLGLLKERVLVRPTAWLLV